MSRPQVVYGVIPRSFSDEGLAGVEKRLPDLAELGVDMIWLSPIFEHPPHDFGYGTTNFRRVDPEHGAVDHVKRLVETAHGNGLRIILDFAPNHTSDRHPFYADVREQGDASAYAGHYVRGEDGAYAYYFNWTNLINLDYGHPDVQQTMLEAMEYWINECDVDGYRFDAAWGIRQRTPQFWPRCVRRLRQCKPDLFLLAEASAMDPYYVEVGFDAAYDWTSELGTWAWTSAFKPYDDRGPVRWPENRELRDFHRRLIRLRRQRLAGYCQLTVLANDQSEQCLSYVLHGSGPPLVCTFNFGPAVEVHVELPAPASGVAKDVWSEDTIPVRDARLALSQDGNAFSLLELGGDA
jgi:glycosidase